MGAGGLAGSCGFQLCLQSVALRLELGGDLGPGRVTAESDSTEKLIAFSRRVSKTLADAGVRHRFEIYSGADELAAYLHHDWPKDW